jgi:hypothetical protein
LRGLGTEVMEEVEDLMSPTMASRADLTRPGSLSCGGERCGGAGWGKGSIWIRADEGGGG